MSSALGDPRLDGAASLLIGLILAGVAAFLAYESRGLLLGEAASPRLLDEIRVLARSRPEIDAVGRPLTMHLGPEDVLLNLSLRFRPGLNAGELAGAVERLEDEIRRRHPEVKRIFVEADALREAGKEQGEPAPA